jgi:hypothetical protein
MARSWKEQMLLNIVKFRYFDAPAFLDGSSVVSTRDLQTQADATARLFPHPYTTSAMTPASSLYFWSMIAICGPSECSCS